jgi:hypothetical protein
LFVSRRQTPCFWRRDSSPLFSVHKITSSQELTHPGNVSRCYTVGLYLQTMQTKYVKIKIYVRVAAPFRNFPRKLTSRWCQQCFWHPTLLLLASLLLLVFIAVACMPAVDCVPAASIAAVAGLPLVPDILSPCFCCRPVLLAFLLLLASLLLLAFLLLMMSLLLPASMPILVSLSYC